MLSVFGVLENHEMPGGPWQRIVVLTEFDEEAPKPPLFEFCAHSII